MAEDWRKLREPHQRLAWAREKLARFSTPVEAARALRIKRPTFYGHENGSRGLTAKMAARYAAAYNVNLAWLLDAKGEPRPDMAKTNGALVRSYDPEGPEEAVVRTVPLVGYVGASSEMHLYAVGQGELDYVDAPKNATGDTVAVVIRGESLGPDFKGFLVFYDDVRRPITSDLIDQLCVVGLADGRVLVKRPKRSRKRGLFNLHSQYHDPIEDVEIEWAAKAKEWRQP